MKRKQPHNALTSYMYAGHRGRTSSSASALRLQPPGVAKDLAIVMRPSKPPSSCIHTSKAYLVCPSLAMFSCCFHSTTFEVRGVVHPTGPSHTRLVKVAGAWWLVFPSQFPCLRCNTQNTHLRAVQCRTKCTRCSEVAAALSVAVHNATGPARTCRSHPKTHEYCYISVHKAVEPMH
jgi:hypothetical protein